MGHQTRAHRDLDIDLDARCEESALAVLAEMGYTVETDWRPNRVELNAPGRGRVDLHPFSSARTAAPDRRPSTGGSTCFRGPSSSLARWPAFRCTASPSSRSVCSAPAMSCEASIGTTSLSSTSWTGAAVAPVVKAP